MALENRLRRTTKPAPNVSNMIAKRVKLQYAWLKPPYQHNGKGLISVWRSKDVRTLRSLVMDSVVVHQITKEHCLRNPSKDWLANCCNACKILVCQQERGVPTEMPMSLADSVSRISRSSGLLRW